MELSVEEIRENLKALEERIQNACKNSNRSRESIKLIWVSKFHAKEAVENAIQIGAKHFGENRVQEAIEKFTEKDAEIYCHIIGPVQSNKLKKAALVADSIHSITSYEALEKLEKVCASNNKILEILFQINAGEEETKSGLEIANAEEFLEHLPTHPHLVYKGLMTIGKNTPDPEDSRSCFAYLRKLQQKFLAKGGIFSQFTELSMGMTGDLEIAIEEGSTMIRVGTALFGERHYL